MTPKLSLAEHLGLYTAFHRASGNRFAHALLVPVIFVTGLCFPAFVGVGCLLHLGTLLVVLLSIVLASVDLVGSLVLFMLLLPTSIGAGMLIQTCPSWAVVLVALSLHVSAWYGTVVIGHKHLEPHVDLGDAVQDSNVYFRRGYFRAIDLGKRTSLLDRLVQFSIAPLACVQDVLVVLGLRQRLQSRVLASRNRVLLALAANRAPFAHQTTRHTMRARLSGTKVTPRRTALT